MNLVVYIILFSYLFEVAVIYPTTPLVRSQISLIDMEDAPVTPKGTSRLIPMVR